MATGRSAGGRKPMSQPMETQLVEYIVLHFYFPCGLLAAYEQSLKTI